MHINRARGLQRSLNRILGNLIKADPVDLFILCLSQLQRFHQVPGNGLSLTVRVRCEINLVCFLHFFSKLCQNISFSANRNIFWFIIMLSVKSEAALW